MICDFNYILKSSSVNCYKRRIPQEENCIIVAEFPCAQEPIPKSSKQKKDILEAQQKLEFELLNIVVNKNLEFKSVAIQTEEFIKSEDAKVYDEQQNEHKQLLNTAFMEKSEELHLQLERLIEEKEKKFMKSLEEKECEIEELKEAVFAKVFFIKI
ncbi:uncharacterized protein LOC135143457 [Zophobas morio]|uniref:uncharacterized protein LOC135143457 n=1 Tax=Zophobas morio TaxID=2755281 RepID=UPI003083C408